MNEEFYKKIEEKIDSGKITPLPRWRFKLLRLCFWFLALLSVLVGSLAVAVIMFFFIDYSNHGLFSIPHDLKELLLMIPVLWLFVFVLFVALAEAGIKHTKQGYKYSLSKISLLLVLLSIILGCGISLIGVGQMAHEALESVPVYHATVYDSKHVWNRPVAGKLAGTISIIQDDNNFSIIDFNGRVWHVRFATSTKNKILLEASSTVRMVGVLEASTDSFVVHSIHIWEK
jgi:hypothetical protein